MDKATEESPTVEGDAKAPLAEVDATPDSSQSTPKATEEGTNAESSSSNEDNQSKEADFPSIDPAAGNDAIVAEGGDIDITVSG